MEARFRFGLWTFVMSAIFEPRERTRPVPEEACVSTHAFWRRGAQIDLYFNFL